MRKTQQINFFNYLDHLLVFVFCVLVFNFLTEHVGTDINVHLEQIIKINSGEAPYPPNFLYYFIVNLFSGFSSQKESLFQVGIVILALATTAKYSISTHIIAHYSKQHQLTLKQVKFIALLLFCCFAIPDGYNVIVLKKMYLGRLVPTVWHNSTTIFLFPFALLLFWKQLKVFQHPTPSAKALMLLNALVVVNILIKPSFLFVYLPVTALLLLKQFRVQHFKKLLLSLTPMLTGGTLILLQYALIYALNFGSFQPETSSVTISTPFELWAKWVPMWYIPIAFLFSLTLPIATMVAYKAIFKFQPFVYALCLSIAGIVLAAFVMETGPRMLHGNFMWQNVICTYCLFLTTILFLIPKFFGNNPIPKTVKVLGVILLLHSLSGIAYLTNIAYTLSYH